MGGIFAASSCAFPTVGVARRDVGRVLVGAICRGLGVARRSMDRSTDVLARATPAVWCARQYKAEINPFN